jgi:hypothetical protein
MRSTNSPLRRQLRASVDLVDLGEALADAGTALRSAGLGIMRLNQPPSEQTIENIAITATMLMNYAIALAKAREVR